MIADMQLHGQRAKLGDPLLGLVKHVAVAAGAAHYCRVTEAFGRHWLPPVVPNDLDDQDAVPQQLYNMADDASEYQLLDRRRVLRLPDLTESISIADAKKISLLLDRPGESGSGNQGLVTGSLKKSLDQQHFRVAHYLSQWKNNER